MGKTQAVKQKPILAQTKVANEQSENKATKKANPFDKLPQALSGKKPTPLVNFKNDLKTHKLELKECPKVAGIELPFCEDEYIYHPEAAETFGQLKERYNIPDGYLRKSGQAAQLGGNGDEHALIINTHIKKEDLDKFVGLKK